MAINGDISDLFFNRDFDHCAEYEGQSRTFTGYNADKLREEAVTFLQNLNRLGVLTPTVDELLTDFHARV